MGKQIAITDSFLSSVFKLNSQERKLVFNTAKQISENPAVPSLHIHSIDREKCDKKFLSARINLDLRMILVRRAEICTLLYVDHHDDAYDWCEGKYLVKTDFGSEYIYDEKLADDKVEMLSRESEIPEYLKFMKGSSLFEDANIKQKNLEKLGIQEIHAEKLMKITDEEQLLEYIDIFPEEIQEALIDLATKTRSFDMVYNSLFNDQKEQNDHETQRFYLTKDMKELEMLIENESFEKWTLFLHPSQDRLVKMNFNGPMLIEGGPGTGKTIVGIHRAVRLAKEYFKAEDNKKILICTYSKKLATDIDHKVNRLCRIKGVQNNIECMSVDSYISKMLGNKALKINLEEIEKIIREIYRDGTWKYSLEFYIQEYYEVIEKYNIKTCDEYLAATRTGSGMKVSANNRLEIWKFFEKVLFEKKERQAYSFVDRAFQLSKLLRNGTVTKKYDSVIIDEAQDLESIKLNVLCNSMISDKNNACIMSDKNQRIFRLNTWSKEAGISIVGRTFYLRVNYRTTKQINDYARNQFMEIDSRTLADREYISIMSGEEPEVVSCKTEGNENHVIVDKIKVFLEKYPAEEICVLAPTYEKLNTIRSILEYEGVGTLLLTGDEVPTDASGVNLCTTSGVKGLEFSVVIIASFNRIGTQRQNYGCAPEVSLNYEKLVECEKYVAITRARDAVLITYLGE